MKFSKIIGRFLFRGGFFLGLLAAVLSGCSGGGSGSSATTSGTGQVLVGVTDAPGDFLRYQVNVVALSLTKADGTQVDALPAESTPVDFAQLTDLTDFLTSATVPQGIYTAATLTVDFTGADIEVEVNGQATPATVVGTDGQPLGQVALPVQLDDSRVLLVAPGTPALLTLDFDLQATNTVDTTQNPPVVTVQPLLIADVNPQAPKPHRVRGPLVSVDSETASFDLAIRPFRQARHSFGPLHVLTDATTVFEVDDQSATGSAGFALLAAKTAGTAVVAVGSVDPQRRSFQASEVYAGSSVAGGTLDALSGIVVARQGDVLTVRGATLDRAAGAAYLHQDRQVTLDPAATTVTRQRDGQTALTPADISVGQQITALGSYDATAGTFQADHVRLLLTQMTGSVVAAQPPASNSDGSLDLNLATIEGRAISLFDFAGTGSSAENDADPANYNVATGQLPLSSVQTGDAVRVSGFVTPFGNAPPDFEARTVADAAQAVAHLVVRWMPATTQAVTVDSTNDKLTLNLAGSPLLHHVFRLGLPTELTADPAPQIVPDPDGCLFALRLGSKTIVYGNFTAFARDLDTALSAGRTVAVLTGLGNFDPSTQIMTAKKIAIGLGMEGNMTP